MSALRDRILMMVACPMPIQDGLAKGLILRPIGMVAPGPRLWQEVPITTCGPTAFGSGVRRE
jgi:hypothetical protein